jgi:hypothetical protein
VGPACKLYTQLKRQAMTSNIIYTAGVGVRRPVARLHPLKAILDFSRRLPLQLLEMPERSGITIVRPYAHRHGIRYINH